MEKNMDPYETMTRLIFDLQGANDWPDFQNLLRRAVSRKPGHWRLPLIGCKAVGGEMEQAIPAMAALACLQISILLIDDMLDGDPRGVHTALGIPRTANLGLAFYSTGLESVCKADLPHPTLLLLLHRFTLMMLTISFGQHLDVQGPKSEEDYWRIVRMKSSPFFGAALFTGAVMGGASPEAALQLAEIGQLYGEMIQIHDDLNDAMATPANSDWTSGRSPLPILFAQTVDHPERARFIELRRIIPNPDALSEAQAILIRCGAVSYCIDQLLRRYHTAKRFLTSIALPFPEEIESLLESCIQPVNRLLAAAKLSQFNEQTKLPGEA